jgi:2-oxoglutarate ferredoxin oxidoreductase subunit delta
VARAAKVWKVLVNPAWCKACGICVAFCPRQVLQLDDGGKAVVVREADCSGCRLCEYRCPDLAMTVLEDGPG